MERGAEGGVEVVMRLTIVNETYFGDQLQQRLAAPPCARGLRQSWGNLYPCSRGWQEKPDSLGTEEPSPKGTGQFIPRVSKCPPRLQVWIAPGNSHLRGTWAPP